MRFSLWSKNPSSSLSRRRSARLLLLVGDEVVLLTRDLLQEDQLRLFRLKATLRASVISMAFL